MSKNTTTTTETKATTEPKKPRQISPEIQALRDEHKAKVDLLNKTQASAKILKNIQENLLPKLTPTDREALAKAIGEAKV